MLLALQSQNCHEIKEKTYQPTFISYQCNLLTNLNDLQFSYTAILNLCPVYFYMTFVLMKLNSDYKRLYLEY